LKSGVSILTAEDEEETVVPGGVVADVRENEGICVGEFSRGIEEREVADEPLSIL
jgi:hypothetical protein